MVDKIKAATGKEELILKILRIPCERALAFTLFCSYESLYKKCLFFCPEDGTYGTYSLRSKI
jgi:hypothetical protein